MKMTLAALAFVLCPFALSLPAAAQAREDFRDWSVLRGQGGCVATSSVGLKRAGSGLATMAVYDRDGPGATVTVRVPLGADLSSQIAYTHADRDDAVGLAWQYCDSQTCLASGALSEAEILRLKQGSRVHLAFRPLPTARSLVVPVSLMGFTRAWTAVQDCN